MPRKSKSPMYGPRGRRKSGKGKIPFQSDTFLVKRNPGVDYSRSSFNYNTFKQSDEEAEGSVAAEFALRSSMFDTNAVETVDSDDIDESSEEIRMAEECNDKSDSEDKPQLTSRIEGHSSDNMEPDLSLFRKLEHQDDDEEEVLWQPQNLPKKCGGMESEIIENLEVQKVESGQGVEKLTEDFGVANWGLGFSRDPEFSNSEILRKEVVIPEGNGFAMVFVDKGPSCAPISDEKVNFEKETLKEEEDENSMEIGEKVEKRGKKEKKKKGLEEKAHLTIGGVKIFTNSRGEVEGLKGEKRGKRGGNGQGKSKFKSKSKLKGIEIDFDESESASEIDEVDFDLDGVDLDDEALLDYIQNLKDFGEDLDEFWLSEAKIDEILEQNETETETETETESESESEDEEDYEGESEGESEGGMVELGEVEGNKRGWKVGGKNGGKIGGKKGGIKGEDELEWEEEMRVGFLKEVKKRGGKKGGVWSEREEEYKGMKGKKGKKGGKGKKSIPGEKKRLRKEKIARKRAQRMSEKGLDLVSANEIFSRMVNKEKAQHSFPPMDSSQRSMIHKMAALYRLQSFSEGSGRKRFTVVVSTEHTAIPRGKDLQRLNQMLAMATGEPFKSPQEAPRANRSVPGGSLSLGERKRQKNKGRRALIRALQGRDKIGVKRGEIRGRIGGERKAPTEVFVSSGLLSEKANEEVENRGGLGDRKERISGKGGENRGKKVGMKGVNDGEAGLEGFGSFEAHTTGIGSKLMAKMGFVVGSGLGKKEQGISSPIMVEKRPKSLGLGAHHDS